MAFRGVLSNTAPEVMIVTDIDVGGRASVAYVAEFGPQSAHVGSTAVRARPRMADRPLLNAPYVEGAVAVVERGNIPIVEKARQCQDAGAAAVLVINTDEEPMMTRGHRHSDGWVDAGGDIQIPVLVVPRSAAGLFDGAPVTRIDFGVSSAGLVLSGSEGEIPEGVPSSDGTNQQLVPPRVVLHNRSAGSSSKLSHGSSKARLASHSGNVSESLLREVQWRREATSPEPPSPPPMQPPTQRPPAQQTSFSTQQLPVSPIPHKSSPSSAKMHDSPPASRLEADRQAGAEREQARANERDAEEAASENIEAELRELRARVAAGAYPHIAAAAAATAKLCKCVDCSAEAANNKHAAEKTQPPNGCSSSSAAAAPVEEAQQQQEAEVALKAAALATAEAAAVKAVKAGIAVEQQRAAHAAAASKADAVASEVMELSLQLQDAEQQREQELREHANAEAQASAELGRLGDLLAATESREQSSMADARAAAEAIMTEERAALQAELESALAQTTTALEQVSEVQAADLARLEAATARADSAELKKAALEASALTAAERHEASTAALLERVATAEHAAVQAEHWAASAEARASEAVAELVASKEEQVGVAQDRMVAESQVCAAPYLAKQCSPCRNAMRRDAMLNSM